MTEESTHISRADLESKFRALQADIQGRASDKKQSLIAAGSTIATIVVIIAYVLGRRSGRRRGSRVEFRRF
jgi:ABC-type glycerol-3-phosphate transport system permease component